MQIAFLIVTALASLLRPTPAGAEPPSCLTGLLRNETGTHSASLPPPQVTPATGEAGTAILVRGSGVEPGSRVEIVAVYGDSRCRIVGLGDQHLGTTKADGSGRYELRRPWPDTFQPWQGRGSFEPVPLPAGRYYVLAIPCPARSRCSFTDGSLPSEPFIQGDPDRTGGGPGDALGRGPILALAAAALTAITVATARAHRHRRTIGRR